MKTFDHILEESVLSVLHEQEEQDKKSENQKDKKEKTSKIFAGGAFGGGSWPSDINAYESRAAKDPSSLVKDLGIKNISGESDLEKCYNFLMQAIKNNSVMNEAFEKPKLEKIEIGDQEKTVCTIKSKDLQYRLAAKYICLALIAGEKADLLNLETGIKFVSKNELSYPAFYEV